MENQIKTLKAENIAERLHAAESLRESEERFRTTFAAAATGIATSTPQGQFLQANAAYCQMLGYTEKELLSCNFAALTHPDDLTLNLKLRDELLAGVRDSFVMEKRYLKKNGDIVWTLHSVSAVRVGGGEITMLIVVAENITERKHAEEQLRWKTAFLEAQVDSSLDGVLVVDSNGIKILQNQKMVDIWNMPAEIAESADDQRQLKWVKSQIKNPVSFVEKVDYLYAHPDEVSHDKLEFISGKFVDRYSAPVKGKSGEYYGRIWVFRDITEQNRVEQRFRRLVDSNAQAVCFWNTKGEITGGNDAFLKLTRYTRDDLNAGRVNWASMTPTEYADSDQRALQALADTGVSEAYEKEWICKDGTRVPILLGSAIFEDNRDEGVCFVLDLTERKRHESLLHMRDRAIQAISQAIVISDCSLPDYPIIYVSPSFEQMTGYTAEEVIGQNCRFLQGKNTDPKAVAQLREAIQQERSCTVELLNYRKDGTVFWNNLTISPVREQNGKLTHFVGVQTDVTARRHLEEQLHQSQKMEAIGQLAGGIAHDFNNLLTVINGYADVLIGSLQPDDPSQRFLSFIKEAGEQSSALTNQLLAFSKNQFLSPKAINLNEVVNKIEAMLRRIIGEDILLSTALSPHLGSVMADPTQMEQILLNLAVNARDAMPRGGKLTIETNHVDLDESYAETHSSVQPGPYVMLAVTDSGTGMPEKVRQHIFEPFFTTKGVGKGTGLGLSVVHGIVKQSEGSIEVYSELGQGTCFKIYLPQISCSVSNETPAADTNVIKRGNETILLVEDEAHVREFARHVLTGYGYTILVAGNAKEALLISEQHKTPIHLLLTDVVMPETGGRELAEQLQPTRPQMKVLFMSGYTEDAVVRHGILHERVNFLQKPYSPLALAQKVREVLK